MVGKFGEGIATWWLGRDWTVTGTVTGDDNGVFN